MDTERIKKQTLYNTDVYGSVEDAMRKTDASISHNQINNQLLLDYEDVLSIRAEAVYKSDVKRGETSRRTDIIISAGKLCDIVKEYMRSHPDDEDVKTLTMSIVKQ